MIDVRKYGFQSLFIVTAIITFLFGCEQERARTKSVVLKFIELFSSTPINKRVNRNNFEESNFTIIFFVYPNDCPCLKKITEEKFLQEFNHNLDLDIRNFNTNIIYLSTGYYPEKILKNYVAFSPKENIKIFTDSNAEVLARLSDYLRYTVKTPVVIIFKNGALIYYEQITIDNINIVKKAIRNIIHANLLS